MWTERFDWDGVSVGSTDSARLTVRPCEPLVDRITAWRRGRTGPHAAAEAAAFEALVPHPRPVSWAAMCEVQQALCGHGGFRTGPAHCRGRRYGWREGLEDRFARKIARDAQVGSPVVRAIRLYLDVIHVHPFADGNARAAVLWASWVLAGAGWPVPDMGAIVRVPKPPGDARVVAVLVKLLE
ncbi:MAG: Fic family protein [Myxococcota bacterium]